jgi:hypothetical protein
MKGKSMTGIFRSLHVNIGVAALVALFALSLPIVSRAQDASPMPMNMGDCVVALGIGTSGDACINVVHASPDAPAVDVYLDGTKALEGLEFGKTSGWVAVPAGDHQVQVVPAGGDPSSAVIDVMVTLEAGAAYEVAATGVVANIAPQIYQVDLSDLDASSARVRVIHTSPDAPTVDVAVKGGDVLIPNLAFPHASDFLTVPAGSYDLEVRPAGTMDVALDLPGVQLEAGKVYDVFAIGTLADGSLAVLVIPSTTSMTVATPMA